MQRTPPQEQRQVQGPQRGVTGEQQQQANANLKLFIESLKGFLEPRAPGPPGVFPGTNTASTGTNTSSTTKENVMANLDHLWSNLKQEVLVGVLSQSSNSTSNTNSTTMITSTSNTTVSNSKKEHDRGVAEPVLKGFRPWSEVKEIQLKEEKDPNANCAHLGIPSRGSSVGISFFWRRLTFVGCNLLLKTTLGLTKMYMDINDSLDNKFHNKRRKVDETSPLLAGRYRIMSEESPIGVGTFSKLVKAEDIYTKRQVAIKIMKPNYERVGVQEIRTLKIIRRFDPMGFSHIIKILSTFYYKDHLCLVMELLHSNLLQEIQNRSESNGMSLDDIRKITLQILICLVYLEKLNIIHADLKPENILLKGTKAFERVVSTRSIKIIDFGNSMKCSDSSIYFDDFEVQSLYYRAPEVLLVFTVQYMWSVGCIIMELYKGAPLFRGKTKQEVLHKMISVLGPIPSSPFAKGKFYLTYFSKQGTFLYDKISEEKCVPLHGQVVGTHDNDFIDFLFKVLEYDPKKRLTPLQALQHPFIAPLCPFLPIITGSSYAPSSLYSRLAVPPFLNKSIGTLTKTQKTEEDDFVEIMDVKDELITTVSDKKVAAHLPKQNNGRMLYYS